MPSSASSLNLVERWFAIITGQAIRRRRFDSVRRRSSAAHSQHFQHVAQNLRFGTAGPTRNLFKQDGHFRTDPDVELTDEIYQ